MCKIWKQESFEEETDLSSPKLIYKMKKRNTVVVVSFRIQYFLSFFWLNFLERERETNIKAREMEAAAACLMQLESFFFVNNRGHDKKKL